MTTAIEQAKREMYQALNAMRGAIRINYSVKNMEVSADVFEGYLESYLELLRQDHEALHETARKRFEDLQAAETANQELQACNDRQCGTIQAWDKNIRDLETRLAKMTEERDSIQLRLHAVDHAYKAQQDHVGTSGQVSGDSASCATPGSKVRVIIEAIDQCKWEIEMWSMKEIRAREAIRTIANTLNDNPELNRAINELAPNCMHSFFAIGDDQMKCTFCGVEK